MPSFDPVAAALRALEVLRAVNRLSRPNVTAIQKHTEINRPTVVRMLETLEHAGYIVRESSSKTYAVTSKVFELSSSFDLAKDLGAIAKPTLLDVRKELGWPSDVAMFDRGSMVVTATSRGEERIFVNRQPGYRAPVFGTSLGLAFVAFCSDDDRAQAIEFASRSSEPWNDPLRKPRALSAMLKKIRADGYATMHPAYNEREYNGLAGSLGVPVLVDGIAIASVNVLFINDVIDRDAVTPRYVSVLRAAADKLGKILSR